MATEKSFFYILKVYSDEVFSDILKAELAEIGFDTFLEHEGFFETSILSENFDQNALREVIRRYESQTRIDYTLEKAEKENWNLLWEKYYDPIRIAGRCLIRADFHQIAEKYDYELIINPKMSFGTGHHQTTSLMIENQMEIDHKGKKVADFGCGTGVLAIMAVKLGAAHVEACDIDDWAVENARENAENNGVSLHLWHGTAVDSPQKSQYDIILANITRNVLHSEMPIYAEMLKNSGFLVLSGFYENDVPSLLNRAKEFGIQLLSQKTKDNWCSIILQKMGENN
jgi:ribosomal protein L11 methyltransferase